MKTHWMRSSLASSVCYEVPLDALSQEPRIKDDEQREQLTVGRRQLHDALSKLPEGPVPFSALPFSDRRAYELSRIEWDGKIDVELRPDMGCEQDTFATGDGGGQQDRHQAGSPVATDRGGATKKL